MKKKECPSCAMMVDSESKTCPVCEFEFPDTHKNKPWIILLLLGLVIILALVGWFKRVF